MTTEIDTAEGRRATPRTPDSDYLELPFGWEPGPGAALGQDADAVFRFPCADDTGPGPRRLLGMALYASLLGLLSLAGAVNAVVSTIAGSHPGWYVPVLAVSELSGAALAIGAFLSIHRRRLPWLLLLASTVPLAATVAITVRVG